MKTSIDTLIEPLRSKRTFEAVSDQLKELILKGSLKPGQQLPSESTLAQLFHVGRQSVREGLRILELSGFITTKPGIKGGAVIESTMLSRIGGLFLDAFKFDRVAMEDFLTARRAIESAILGLVLDQADAADMDELRENIALAKTKVRGGAAAFEENIAFHRLLAKASKNHVFCLVMEALLAVLSDFKSKLSEVELAQSQRIVDFHEALTEAILGKKKRLARDLLKKDLRHAGDILNGVYPRLYRP